MQRALVHLDSAVMEEVSVGVWRQLFDAVGWPLTLLARRDAFGHEDVIESLSRDAPSDELLEALEVLHTLGTTAGREAIVAAMEDRGVPATQLPSDVGEREYALHLYLAQRTDAALAEVSLRAQTQVQARGEYRSHHDFVGREARAVTHLGERRSALEAMTVEYCRASGLGEHVHVRVLEDDGVYIFSVIRSDRMRTPLAVVPGSMARTTLAYRPVHCDILRYDAGLGRVRVAARSASVVAFYRAALGAALFDDRAFFEGAAASSLRVLQERRRRALEDHGIPGIGEVRLTEVLWERGDGDLLHIRSRDCFRHIEELRLPIEEGEFLQAKLKASVTGRSTRPVTITVRVPHRAEWSQPRHEHLIEQLLTRVGIFEPAAAMSRRDLWALYPWRHPREEWQRLFGAETDRLIEQRVLRPVRLARLQSAEMSDAGRLLQAEELDRGEFYAVSDLPEVPSRTVTATDLDGFALDPDGLRQALRTRLGAVGAVRGWTEGDELLDIGVIDLGGPRIHLFYALRPPGPAVSATLQAGGAPDRPALLVPSPSYASSALPVAVLDRPLPDRATVIHASLRATGLMDQVTAIYSAPPGARLVVDRRSGTVWYDGVEIRKLKSPHALRFVEMLALGTRATDDELRKELSPGRRDENTVVRQAKSAACNAMREAVREAGIPWEEPFDRTRDGERGYRCTVITHVV